MDEATAKTIRIASWALLPTWGFWVAGLMILALIERLSVPPCRLDRMLLEAAQGMQSAWLDTLFMGITRTGSFTLLALLTGFIGAYLFRRKRAGDVWLLGLSLAGASLLAHMAKPLFGRPRPDLFAPIGELPLDAAFPSGHTAQIVAFALSVYLVFRPKTSGVAWRLGGALLLWTAMLALSRIYLQVHYPSDVLGGATLALLWVLGLENLLQFIAVRSR